MKKVCLIIILFLSCYFIYNKTINEKLYYLTIGDAISKGTNGYNIVTYGYNDHIKDYLSNKNKLKEYNKTFTNNDYTIEEIARIIKYNETKDGYTLNRLIKKADIITISLGMNELYYKLEQNNENIYTYIDNILDKYQEILDYINKFHHQKVYILGFYNTLGKDNDIFEYANYNLNKLCNKYNYTYIDLSKQLDNNPNYIANQTKFIPNSKGYEKIFQIIVENLENNWYNITCKFITMTFCHGGRREKNEKEHSSKWKYN